MRNISITEEDIKLILKSLDINIRANGLNVSAACTILAEKLSTTTQNEEVVKDKVEVEK